MLSLNIPIQNNRFLNPVNAVGNNASVVLGIGGALGHDSNAALMVDGKLISASQEERFSRIKHDSRFPYAAIQDCLNIAGLKPEEVDTCIFTEKPLQRFLYSQTQRPSSWISRLIGKAFSQSWHSPYTSSACQLLPNAKLYYAWHHLTHVAAAFYTSPFERAAFLCLDGIGEDVSASIGYINHHQLEILYEQPYENGLGMFYFLVTNFLGFRDWGSEYKVMGLSAYGKPNYVKKLRSLLIEGNFSGLRLKKNVVFTHKSICSAIKCVEAATGIPARESGSPITSQHIDIAASLQSIFEQEVMEMAKFVHKKTNEENLLFCGGCAQNCVLAGHLRDRSSFKHVFTSPVGSDMGNSLGAALLYERQKQLSRKNQVTKKFETRGFYLGSSPGKLPIEALPYILTYEGSLHALAAQMLSDGKIIGWVRGRMELGPRALGARSILADPRQPNMQSVLNQKIKFRESFRPFAPAIIAEEANNWFDISFPSNFMQYTANLKPELRNPQPEKFESLMDRLNFARCNVPSVVHVDYSARIQTVEKDIHSDFYRLLYAFFKLTGVPMLINTSFNVSDQPIVRTAMEAWECFINTDIDILIVNDDILKNPFVKTQEEKIQWAKKFAHFSL